MDELHLDQYALLVGIVKSASLHNLENNLKRALGRKNLVVLTLCNQGSIEKNYLKLSQRSLKIHSKEFIIADTLNFLLFVQKKVKEKLRNKTTRLEGLKIFTTLDSVSQNAIANAVSVSISELKKQKKLKYLEVEMIVVKKFNGAINAFISATHTIFYYYNHVLKVFCFIGSFSKPVMYLKVLSNTKKYHLNSWISNYLISIKLANDRY
ncbi:MAG: hypothetical protein G4B00_01015 [Buchnera aphidicola (Aphis urticata)]|uniref:Uncharacterized protein n=1 Tax=Buchnera aphidicola (Aphis urticata) TaxID=2708353 RepID=A0AAJ4GC71_9GAMM|nr:MAG: hypothetical protein G4B00_01015 [Buchnera aphidicola (Aphis urticata)]